MTSADNQQETSANLFYYTGFCVGEFSCSILRLSNRRSKTGGVYYTPDITISNAELSLLKEINSVVAGNLGVITSIKGGYNLSVRGKNKVKKILSFFTEYPPIAGDLAQSRLLIIHQALSILEKQKSFRRTIKTQKRLEKCRELLKRLKETANPLKAFPQKIFSKNAIGYFLAGILDAEGSVGIKKSGSRFQPFVAVAMKDKKIVELFKDFLGVGHIHGRPKEKIYHYEIGSREAVLKSLKVFLEDYPVKLSKMRKRSNDLRRILNDYTPRSSRQLAGGK